MTGKPRKALEVEACGWKRNQEIGGWTLKVEFHMWGRYMYRAPSWRDLLRIVRTLMRTRFVLPAAVLLASSACTSQPTAAVTPVQSVRLDVGGYGLGSGNRTDSTQTHAATASTSGTVAASGYGLGSGN